MASRSSLSVPQITMLLLLLLSSVSAQKVINLSGSDWTLQNLPLNISVPGSVPSQAHLDLYAAQVIGDPYEPPPLPSTPQALLLRRVVIDVRTLWFRYFGLNDFSLRWVADSNWTYISAPIYQLYALLPRHFRQSPSFHNSFHELQPPFPAHTHIYSSN